MAMMQLSKPRWRLVLTCAIFISLICFLIQPGKAQRVADDRFAEIALPILKSYCLDCHSTKSQKGSLDLERFSTSADIRRDLKPWQSLIEQMEAGEMPPKGKPQPTAEEKKKLIEWTRHLLEAEAISRRGDPGHVPLRRLSNAEYDATIRDLTGIDLRPTKEFPADGAAGEGFTNAAEALTDISPALFTKYMNAARDLADHAVLLPDGFRFSRGKTRRDWSDEGVNQLRKFYSQFAPQDGMFGFEPYLAATIRHREAIQNGKLSLEDIAQQEKINGKYLRILWEALSNRSTAFPLNSIQAQWQLSKERDLPALVNEIKQLQNALWQTAKIGSYVRPHHSEFRESLHRQFANDPVVASTQTFRLSIKPVPGQNEVILRLQANELIPNHSQSRVIWQRPRLEGAGKPTLLLAEYSKYGSAYELNYEELFAKSSEYLAASAEAANDTKLSLQERAKKHGLNAELLKRWIEVLQIKPYQSVERSELENIGRIVPIIKLDLLAEKTEKISSKPWLNGWRKKGTDLPIIVSNSSGTMEYIPGRVGAYRVSVHPMPAEFVGVVWKSPISGHVKISAEIAHAHPACGNGVAWWTEHRRGERAKIISEGAVELGQSAKVPEKIWRVEKDDELLLGIDAKNRDHSCDMTEIQFTISELGQAKRVWNLSADVADQIHQGNPHTDSYGNAGVWSFVKGQTRDIGNQKAKPIPTDSTLGKWLDAASDPKRKNELPMLAEEVQKLLTGNRPIQVNDPNRILYDNFVSWNGILLNAIDRIQLPKNSANNQYGIASSLFGMGNDSANISLPANQSIEIHLPAALIIGREFVIEAILPDSQSDRAVQFQVNVPSNQPVAHLIDLKTIVATPKSDGHQKLLLGLSEFRNLFPLYSCFPAVIPTDEVVSLKMFHREDEPLIRLLLNEKEIQQLERLWKNHNFVSKQTILENEHLPQFIGFVTQDQPKVMFSFFESQRPAFQKRANDLILAEQSAISAQWNALLEFASRAFRRPLKPNESTELKNLYQSIRSKGASHEEAFRGTLMRIIISPSFLFRIEESPAGKESKPINDWELATRLSYFLWASTPDEELRTLAAENRLHQPEVLAGQIDRMRNDPRIRSLAVEFGTQWIHVRGFDELKEKNEKLFPTFNDELKRAINEESILFFQDLFQNDRSVTDILDSDATYLNETLAKHYGIPGVTGPQWRRVEGIKKYGRGGVLGLASVQTKESGASRTSPILRGNWVVETLLGERLPRPPANVPRLPEEEGAFDKLTIRQQVERHTSDPSCASCHQRIDPFGFAMEKYDPIGRLREKEITGTMIDTRTKLKDGTEMDGMDGLRNYLLTKKKEVIIRLFCKRLLGYALGRSVTLSDTALLDEMVAELKTNDGKILVAVKTIVKSPQFRMIRGAEQTN